MSKEVRKLNELGEVIAVYPSITEAERQNGICPQTLHSYVKMESPCHGYYYECDGIEPWYGQWNSKDNKRNSRGTCPFEDVLRYFSKVLPYKYRRPCKSYMRRVILHNDMQPDEAFLRYYLKLPLDVYVSSDGIVELVSQWRRLHPERITASDASESSQA